jgi:hypothetical protein
MNRSSRKWLALNLPGGSVAGRKGPVLSQKKRLRRRANHGHQLAPSRLEQEGRFAIVTNVERGMRWTPFLRKTNAGEADGEVVAF